MYGRGERHRRLECRKTNLFPRRLHVSRKLGHTGLDAGNSRLNGCHVSAQIHSVSGNSMQLTLFSARLVVVRSRLSVTSTAGFF